MDLLKLIWLYLFPPIISGIISYIVTTKINSKRKSDDFIERLAKLEEREKNHFESCQKDINNLLSDSKKISDKVESGFTKVADEIKDLIKQLPSP